MTVDVATGDPTHLLCLNCARKVISPRVVSKYEGLTRHLRFRSSFTSSVKLTFARIDGLIGTNLPMAAFRNESWWSNSTSSAHSKGWLDAGWEVEEVNLKEGFAVFRKVQIARPGRSKRKRLSNETKPFKPVPVRRLRSKVPSKTKASKLYARIVNLEKQRKSGFGSGKGFKPHSSYEKRLFKSDKKPQ